MTSGEPISPTNISEEIGLSVNLGLGEKVVYPLPYNSSILSKLDSLNTNLTLVSLESNGLGWKTLYWPRPENFCLM